LGGHFVGAPAARVSGPKCRFAQVSGPSLTTPAGPAAAAAAAAAAGATATAH